MHLKVQWTFTSRLLLVEGRVCKYIVGKDVVVVKEDKCFEIAVTAVIIVFTRTTSNCFWIQQRCGWIAVSGSKSIVHHLLLEAPNDDLRPG